MESVNRRKTTEENTFHLVLRRAHFHFSLPYGVCSCNFTLLCNQTKPKISGLKTFKILNLIHIILASFPWCSINTVYYMAPFATMILAVPALLLEGAGVMDWLHTHQSLLSSLLLIFSSGVMAFCLNFSIFYVIHSTTAVTFNVAGNLKVNLIPPSFT